MFTNKSPSSSYLVLCCPVGRRNLRCLSLRQLQHDSVNPAANPAAIQQPSNAESIVDLKSSCSQRLRKGILSKQAKIITVMRVLGFKLFVDGTVLPVDLINAIHEQLVSPSSGHTLHVRAQNQKHVKWRGEWK